MTFRKPQIIQVANTELYLGKQIYIPVDGASLEQLTRWARWEIVAS